MPAFAPAFDPQLATDAILTKIATDVSAPAIVQCGAIKLEPGFPIDKADNSYLGTKVDVPYFNLPGIGQDIDTLDTAVTFNEGVPTKQQASIKLFVYGWKYNDWQQLNLSHKGDPYGQLAQIVVNQKWYEAVARESIVAMGSTSLTLDLTASTITYDGLVNGLAKFADQERDICCVLVHSKVLADLRKLKDANGYPILLEQMGMIVQPGNMLGSMAPGGGMSGYGVGPSTGDIRMLFGKYPVIVSDKVPFTPAAGANPDYYGTLICKKESAIYWYNPAGFNVQDYNDITVSPTVRKHKVEVFKAVHRYNPYPGSSLDGVVKITSQ